MATETGPDSGPTTATLGADSVLDIEHYVPGLLTFLANKLSRGASAIYRREFRLGINDWRVMALLALESQTVASRIAQLLGVDKSVVSRSLATLEKRGLVAIDEPTGQTRARQVRLTDAGRTQHDRMIGVALERERRLLACLNNEERSTLIGMLARMHARLPDVNRPIKLSV